MAEFTELLRRMEAGDTAAPRELLALVYQDLRTLAAQRMRRERPGLTLQPTALVHEAWLRLGGDHQPPWEGRAHFFGAAAEAMRRILVEEARRRGREKRGGGVKRVDLDEVTLIAPMPDEELVALDEALAKLEAEDPRAATVVKLRFFVGLTTAEISESLDLSVSTVERVWAFARAWLFRELERDPESK
ncbi:MAG: ECF-type sigma factor [Candidatus Eisenbacteria bacterium]